MEMKDMKEELIEVKLRSGRVEVSDVVNLRNYNGDCETNTNNQTQATCC